MKGIYLRKEGKLQGLKSDGGKSGSIIAKTKSSTSRIRLRDGALSGKRNFCSGGEVWVG